MNPLVSPLSRICLGLYLCFIASVASAQDDSTEPSQTVNPEDLLSIEATVLPRPLVEGPAQHERLVDYYTAANAELAYRMEHAREIYESEQKQPTRRVTLVAGAAGVGKTFLKGLVFSKDYPQAEVCRFDVGDLYKDWLKEGRAIEKPDLASRGVVLNSLPSLKDSEWPGLYDYLNDQPASFYVIDSLDEIHPDDYVPVLEQVERFVFESDRPFLHVVVLGRGLAFREYWEKKAGYYPSSELNLYMLSAPHFRTLGDLRLSSWNYHKFFHKLSWATPDDGEFTLQDYEEWESQDFARTGRFANVHVEPSDAVDPVVEQSLAKWATEYPYINSMLRNLAGNGMIREIAFQRIRAGEPYNEEAIKRDFFSMWLERDTRSEKRPSAVQPEHFELYLQLLEEVAIKYLKQRELDSHGFFTVDTNDMIEVDYRGSRLSFPIHRILERSGLKYLDPRTPGSRRYRFEPIWLQRLLVDLYNQRVSTRDDLALNIWLDAEGAAHINGEPVEAEVLKKWLVSAHESAADGRGALIIQVDHRCETGALLTVVQAARTAGLADIRIKTDGCDMLTQPASIQKTSPAQASGSGSSD